MDDGEKNLHGPVVIFEHVFNPLYTNLSFPQAVGENSVNACWRGTDFCSSCHAWNAARASKDRFHFFTWHSFVAMPMGSWGVALLWGFSDPSWPWGSLGEIYKWGSVAGWLTSTGPNGKVLVIPKGRLASLSGDLVWVPGQNLWPLIGLNPGSWLAFSQVTTPWGDISTY